MISDSLKKNYSLLSGKTLYYRSLSSFAQDSLFKLYRDKEDYKKFIEDISRNLPSKTKKIMEMFTPFIIENVILITKTRPIFYGYTDNLVVTLLNQNSDNVTQSKQILGSINVFIAINNFTDDRLVSLITTAVDTYSRLLLTCTTRPLDFNELYPEIGRVLSVWYLKLYNKLSLKNLSILLSNNNISFISASDTQKLLDSVSNVSSFDPIFHRISEILKSTPSQVQTLFVNKYSMDFMLGLENLFQFLYMASNALIFTFPDQLYFKLKQLSLKNKQLLQVPKLISNKYKTISR